MYSVEDFVQPIIQEPNDISRRMVLADFLEETSHPKAKLFRWWLDNQSKILEHNSKFVYYDYARFLQNLEAEVENFTTNTKRDYLLAIAFVYDALKNKDKWQNLKLFKWIPEWSIDRVISTFEVALVQLEFHTLDLYNVDLLIANNQICDILRTISHLNPKHPTKLKYLFSLDRAIKSASCAYSYIRAKGFSSISNISVSNNALGSYNHIDPNFTKLRSQYYLGAFTNPIWATFPEDKWTLNI